MIFAINPLLFLAGIVLYAFFTSIRDHIRYRHGKSEAPAPAQPHTLEIREGCKAAESEIERRPAA